MASMRDLIHLVDQIGQPEVLNEKKSLKTDNPCWKGYHPVGTKKKDGKTVPNCVPNESIEDDGEELTETESRFGPIGTRLMQVLASK